MASPPVSVVMCTYNGSEVISEQIESILHQDFDDFELLIVDDRSTDNTFEQLKRWQEKSTKIRLFQNEANLGYNKNFEKAISLAEGEFIAISDQDDIWMPEKISLQLKAFSSPEVLVTHGMSVLLENGELQYKKRKLHHHYSGSDPKKFFLFNPVQGHDMMFRGSLKQYVLPVPDNIIYDWWIAVNAAAMGKIVSVPAVLVHQRIHETNSFFGNPVVKRKTQPDLGDVLQAIKKVNGLNDTDMKFLQTLLDFVKNQSTGNAKFNRSFFNFLFENRRIFFGHKKRMFPALNHLKNAIKYAKTDFKGKGLSY